MAMMKRLRMKTIGTSIMVVQDQTSYVKEYLQVHEIRAGKKEPSISLLIILLWKLDLTVSQECSLANGPHLGDFMWTCLTS